MRNINRPLFPEFGQQAVRDINPRKKKEQNTQSGHIRILWGHGTKGRCVSSLYLLYTHTRIIFMYLQACMRQRHRETGETETQGHRDRKTQTQKDT